MIFLSCRKVYKFVGMLNKKIYPVRHRTGKKREKE